MAKHDLPTPETLRQLLRYEADTGKLFWLHRQAHFFPDTDRRNNACAIWNAKFAGKEAKARSNHGYIRFSLLGVNLLAHRVAWTIHYGQWPETLDHINGIRTDNRISNLRLASVAENNRNLTLRTTSTSGTIGVSLFRGVKWRAYITDNGKQISLGCFMTIEEAQSARKAAEVALGFHPNHGRVRTTQSGA